MSLSKNIQPVPIVPIWDVFKVNKTEHHSRMWTLKPSLAALSKKPLSWQKLDFDPQYTTLQIFWLQKLQLLAVLRVQLQSGCNICNHQLQLLLVAIFATLSSKRCNYTNC